MHYVGDEGEYEAAPHGNSKSNTREHIRTCPSVITKLKEQDHNSPINVYQESTANQCPPTHQAVLCPRDLKQVQNSIQNSRSSKRLSQDDVYNLLCYAYEMDGFITELSVYPDLKCFMGLPEVMQEFNRLLQLNSDYTLYCSYDTTFDLGDFYLTPIVFRHVLFENSPVIPLAFMIHRRKYQSLHEDFLRNLCKHIPNLQKSTVPIITDRERSITNALTNVLPNAQVFYCWNHFKQDIIRWLGTHKAAKDETRVYLNHIEQILMSATEDEFHDNIAQLSATWSQPFLEYFDKHLKKDIEQHAGRWLIEPLNIYNPYSGITNNAAESMNTVIKRLTGWKQRPADTLALCLHKLQNYYWNEILRGCCDLGQYKLRQEFSSLAQKPEDLQFPTDFCDPNNIIERVKESINITQHNTNIKVEPDTDSASQDPESDTTEDPQLDRDYLNATALADEPADRSQWTQVALARAVVNEGRVSHCPKMQTFVVEGNKSSKYCVTLFPKEKCQCPATTTCYHILAAKMSIGQNIEQKKKCVNLTQLIRNTRKNAGKRSGKKAPSTLDYVEVVAAPDSESLALDLLTEEEALPTTKRTNKTSTPNVKKVIQDSRQASKSVTKEIQFDLPDLQENSAPSTPKFPEIMQLDTIDEEMIVEINSDSEDNISTWIPRFGLAQADKAIISGEGDEKWLTSKHMLAAQAILKEQFQHINGLQDTANVPRLVGSTKSKQGRKWTYSSKFQQCSSPGAQIHHNGTDHWLLSVKPDRSGAVIILDSGVSPKLSNSVKIQLSALYGSPKSSLTVSCPRVQQQTSGSGNCGVFAIAFLVEYCFEGYAGETVVLFDEAMMRSHLIECLQKGQFSPFPRQV